MHEDTLLSGRDLGKRFLIPVPDEDRVRRGLWRRPRTARWAVRHVDLDVARGEIVGLVGGNGAGKSTLLRLLARTMHPSEGEFSIRGRVASMLEVGAGFHWELTGRENVYLGGTLLGMDRREVRRRLDAIVEFAGVAEYLDVPVKRYSSGMYARLGFAVAAHLDADVLLVDELFAVADAAFRQRCIDRLRLAASQGSAVVFVSHGLENVRALCDRALLLEAGEVVCEGTPRAVFERYLPPDSGDPADDLASDCPV